MRTPDDRRTRRLQTLRRCAVALLGIATGYLLLERSHAEEVGNGARVAAEFVRGERPISPLTWLAFSVLLLALVVAGRGRVAGPAGARTGR
ncbi:MAG TPA: hypothetical protein VIJ54_03465 [Actinomycetes bacterium]